MDLQHAILVEIILRYWSPNAPASSQILLRTPRLADEAEDKPGYLWNIPSDPCQIN